jgi:hypothetical protein
MNRRLVPSECGDGFANRCVTSMNRRFGDTHFATSYIEDPLAGCSEIRLHRAQSGDSPIVTAEVVFWDASGHFVVETFNGDVPLEIIEELIAEARHRIKVC